ncbi:MAG: RsbRD N-terminal domain-containing protein [Planctomycetes bacterium]|nr:RsbRD N-terminal domain-containing protein [Planctomycetota bacterium]
MKQSERDLAAALGGHIKDSAEDLVAEWIEWARSRLRTKTISALPERALRNHIPPVVRALGNYVLSPVEGVREEMLGHLRLHGQIRRDQGYTIQEILGEFEGLAALVTTRANDFVREREQVSTEDAVAVLSRLAAGLRSTSFVTVETFHESDSARRQSVSAELERFARAVAHELRNPLNTIALATRVLLDDSNSDDPAGRQRHLEIIERAVQRASHLLENMGILAVAENSRSLRQLASVVSAVDSIREELAATLDNAAVEFTVESPLPEIAAEAIVLYLVLMNLLSNAIKYHDPEKPERWIKLRSRYVPEEDDSGFGEIVIQDNGRGIPKELLARVCQPGFRAHPEVAQGTGLGLSIIQRLLTERGGAIALDSEEGVGTTVTVRFRCLEIDVQGGAGVRDLLRLNLPSINSSDSVAADEGGEGADPSGTP